ncbi:MAG: DMT family transporter [Comamonadaceae bacterium]|nr:MAG: DMT family transporter [Comamonadaceae bacterium]
MLLVAAVACFSVLDSTTKMVSMSVPVLMALWFRYAFQAVATTVAVLPTRGWSLLRTAHPKFQLLRGVLLLTTSVLSFFSLKHMPVGEFTAIVMITPLLITLLASVTLGERVSVFRWILVIGGFAGTLIIIRPGGDDFTWAMLLPIGLVISHSWFQILTSRLARTEDPLTMHFYTGWIGALLASLALPFVWVWLDSWVLWGGLALMGMLATIGHYLMILAYGRAPVSTLTPFLYLQVGFAMLAGWLFFSHIPDRWSLIGIALITVCGATGAWLAVRESRVSMEPLEA